jgi:hypothetical protein
MSLLSSNITGSVYLKETAKKAKIEWMEVADDLISDCFSCAYVKFD